MPEPLPPEPQSSVFHPFPWWIFGNAWWQLEEHQYAAGVLLAQVSVEMAARFAFMHLLVRRHGPLDDDWERTLGPPDYSLMEEGTRRLWADLTCGDRITKPRATWSAYHAHVEFRNRIAHGVVWGDAEGGSVARRSVLAAHGMLLRMDETLLRLEGAATGSTPH